MSMLSTLLAQDSLHREPFFLVPFNDSTALHGGGLVSSPRPAGGSSRDEQCERVSPGLPLLPLSVCLLRPQEDLLHLLDPVLLPPSLLPSLSLTSLCPTTCRTDASSLYSRSPALTASTQLIPARGRADSPDFLSSSVSPGPSWWPGPTAEITTSPALMLVTTCCLLKVLLTGGIFHHQIFLLLDLTMRTHELGLSPPPPT